MGINVGERTLRACRGISQTSSAGAEVVRQDDNPWQSACHSHSQLLETFGLQDSCKHCPYSFILPSLPRCLLNCDKWDKNEDLLFVRVY